MSTAWGRTEEAVEEDLRACDAEGHRLFFFRVENAQVAVCSRCEVRFIQDVTAGDGSPWDQQVREAQENEERRGQHAPAADSRPAGRRGSNDPAMRAPSALDAAIADHPAGGRRSNICAFCRPKQRHGPSGKGLWHEASCEAKPGQKVSAQEYAGLMPVGSEPWKGRRLR